MSGQEGSRCRAADNCDEEQVVQRMSVSVKKSCFDELGIYNLDEHLKKIQMKQLERKHVVVHIEKSDNSHQLEGCFCGMKAVREELQQILTEKMKEKQNEIRNEEKRLENEQTTLKETDEAKRQNVSGEILKTRTHHLPMDKDLFNYLEDNCHRELKALCSSIKGCETEMSFVIEIKLNTDEDIAKIKNDISALQNRFVVREQKISEAVNFSKLKDAVTRMATQKINATPIFDSDQKTVKVIGSPTEADEMIKWISTLSVSQHSDVKDKNVIKNGTETENEKMNKDSGQKSLTMEEAKSDQNKTLIDHSKPDYPDRRGTTKDSKTLSDDTMGVDSKTLTDDTMGDDSKTLTDDTMGVDSETLTDDTMGDDSKNDTKDDRKALTGGTRSEYQPENIEAKAETTGDAKKTLNENTKLEISNNRCPSTDKTRGDDAKTQTDCSKSHPDNKGTSKNEGMGHDKKTSYDDNISEHQGKEFSTKDETKVDDKNAPIDNSKSENQNKQGPTAYQNDNKITADDTNAEQPDREVTSSDETGEDNNLLINSTKSENPDKKDTTTDGTKEDTKTLIDETTSEPADKEASSKLTKKGINAVDTMHEHDSVGVSGKESNIKTDICEKREANGRNKENIRDNEARQFFKTGNKSEYNNYDSQGNQSSGATAADNYPPQQPTKQRKLAHHISMDKDVYKYIQGFLRRELEDINKCCNSVQELKDDDSIVKLCYTLKYEVEHETVKRRFQMLLDQVKVEGYNVPDLIDASVLESAVCASTKSEATMIFVQRETNSLKIVGRPDKVDMLKQRIEETVSEQLQSQEELSKGNMYTSEHPCKQHPEKNAYHHITIDENLYTYISTHCQEEMDRASKYCTSINSSKKGSTFTIDFALQDKRDVGLVIRIFEKLKSQFKVEECKVPIGIDFDNLDSIVNDMNTLKEVMIFPLKEKHLMKLIGQNAQVSKTKKWIESLISDSLKSEQLSKHKPHHSSPIKDQPQDRGQSKPVVFNSLQNVNPVNPPRKPGERFKITSITSDTIVYESKRVNNHLTVRVHHGNIIKQKTEVLVSYEDEWLQGCSVLAMALKEAAGPNVTRELSNISKTRGPLEVGQVVHTSSGNLWPQVKYLAHVIRAQRSQYHPEDPNTFKILYQTFLNCFKYTNSKICKNSISIPPISARKYGVQLISAAFSEAVMEYDAIAEATRSTISLHSIHFVDDDPAVVKQMITSMKSLLE